MNLSKLVNSCIIYIAFFISFPCYPAPVTSSLETHDKILPLKSNQGYLLINLQISGTAPSIEYYKINRSHNRFLSRDQKVKKRGSKLSLDLKNKTNGYYLQRLPVGLYQITRINVPYFDLPFRLNTESSREWRFSIEEGMTNYVGKFIIEKERSTKNVSVRLLNRMATDNDEIEDVLKNLLTSSPLRSGAGVRDDFFELLSTGKEGQ